MSIKGRWVSGFAAVALAAGLAAMPAASAATSSDGLPDGSWRQICRNAYVENDTLHASCRRNIGIYTAASARIGSCQAFGFRDGALFCESPGGSGTTAGQWDGSFRNSCRDVSVNSNGTLTASCQASNGSWRRSSLSPNQCSGYRAGNRDGNLSCESDSGTAGQWTGSFRDTCRDVSVDKHGKLQATCRKNNGTYKRTNLQSQKCSSRRAGNRDGNLFCESSGGTASQWNGSFRNSCRDFSVNSSGTLSATCQASNGSWRRTSLTSGQCSSYRAGNRDGNLFCETGDGDVSQWNGSFRNSCRDMSVDSRGTLTATCQASNGSWRRTSLTSGQCGSYRAGNRDGNLFCETGDSGSATSSRWDGSFDRSCRDVSVDSNGTLTATCQTMNGNWNRSSLSSGQCGSHQAGNRDGTLFCER